jgi:hypothetical protein
MSSSFDKAKMEKHIHRHAASDYSASVNSSDSVEESKYILIFIFNHDSQDGLDVFNPREACYHRL